MKTQMNGYGKNFLSMLGTPISWKVITMGVLTLLLLKPVSMIESLINERETRQREVVTEISSKWAGQQTINGPVVSIPYKAPNGSLLYLHFLPEKLHIAATVHPEYRYRGIFKAVLYEADLVLTGSFTYPQTEELKIPRNDIEWESASIAVGVSDVRGIREQTATVNDTGIPMNPGLQTADLMSSGVSAPIELDRRTKEYAFKFVLKVRGSERINFVPLGKSTRVSLSSEWSDPSFDGAYLPERHIGPTTFDATWDISDVNRDYPQYWKGSAYRKQAQSSAFGVGLFSPVDFYQKSMRTTKYAILFVALTFVAFFASELVVRVRLHPIQYLLIGLAITTFYTLLISLSEHFGFGWAYGVSSVSVVALVTVYAASILKSRRLATIVGGVLSMVYAYLYWVLQMVDYAFVAGSVGLFAVLGVIMLLTRKIDWYALTLVAEPQEAEVLSEESSAELAE
ncbi:MAG: cell envelope integrity protein CreD [Thermodesulfobacteriota bacterium]